MPESQRTAVAAQRDATGSTYGLIPVATAKGVVWMDQGHYQEYVKRMGHLPTMSRSYIFGRTIPIPKTDKSGTIHLSDVPLTAPDADEVLEHAAKPGQHPSAPRPVNTEHTMHPELDQTP